MELVDVNSPYTIAIPASLDLRAPLTNIDMLRTIINSNTFTTILNNNLGAG